MNDLGLALLRLTVGAFIFVHGSQKLFGWFGGKGLSGAVEMAQRKGLRPSRLWGTVAAISMTFGGVATFLGLLGPVGPLCIVMSMLTVSIVNADRGFFAHHGGNEHAYMYLVAALAIALLGPGTYSVDRSLDIDVPPPAVAALAALAALAFAGMIATRRSSRSIAAGGRARPNEDGTASVQS